MHTYLLQNKSKPIVNTTPRTDNNFPLDFSSKMSPLIKLFFSLFSLKLDESLNQLKMQYKRYIQIKFEERKK